MQYAITHCTFLDCIKKWVNGKTFFNHKVNMTVDGTVNFLTLPGSLQMFISCVFFWRKVKLRMYTSSSSNTKINRSLHFLCKDSIPACILCLSLMLFKFQQQFQTKRKFWVPWVDPIISWAGFSSNPPDHDGSLFI